MCSSECKGRLANVKTADGSNLVNDKGVVVKRCSYYMLKKMMAVRTVLIFRHMNATFRGSSPMESLVRDKLFTGAEAPVLWTHGRATSCLKRW